MDKHSAQSCSCNSRSQGKCPYCLVGVVLDRGLDALRTMPKIYDSAGRQLCVCCRKVLPAARLTAVKDAVTCVRCQEQFDLANRDRLKLLAARAAKPTGKVQRGFGDGDAPLSSRRRLLRAAPEPAY